MRSKSEIKSNAEQNHCDWDTIEGDFDYRTDTQSTAFDADFN